MGKQYQDKKDKAFGVKKIYIFFILFLLCACFARSVSAKETSEMSLSLENSFEGKRLLVKSGEEFDTYGAEKVIPYADELFVLEYDTKEKADEAYRALQNVSHLTAEKDCIFGEVREENETKKAKKKQLYADEAGEAAETEPLYKEISTSSGKIKIAVLDTGYDRTGNVSERVLNGKDINGKKTAEDTFGHGTQTANIILDITSECVEILPVKVTDETGVTSSLKLYLGIRFALENGADIINISMNASLPTESPLLRDIIKEAYEQGVFVVVSAGNSSDNVKNYSPADIEEAVVVSAINADKTSMAYSNKGKTVDFCSYGKVRTRGLSGEETEATGTSVSAAIVSGMIAQARLMDMSATAEELLQNMKKTALDLGENGWDEIYGYGALTPEEMNALYENNICQTAEIFSCDWKNMSDESMHALIEQTPKIDLQKFVRELSPEEKQMLLEKQTKFSLPCTVYRNVTKEEATCTQQEYFTYYDYLCEEEYEPSWYTDKENQNGYFYLAIKDTTKNISYSSKIECAFKNLKTVQDDRDTSSASVTLVTVPATNTSEAAKYFEPKFTKFKLGGGAGDSNHVYLQIHAEFNCGKHYRITKSADVLTNVNGEGVTLGMGVTNFNANNSADRLANASEVFCTQGQTRWGDSEKEETGIQVGINEAGIWLDGRDYVKEIKNGKEVKGKAVHNGTITISMKENSKEKKETVNATCAKKGKITYQCKGKNCSSEWSEDTEQLKHKWTTKYADSNSVKNGMKWQECSRAKADCGRGKDAAGENWQKNYEYWQEVSYRYMDTDGKYGEYSSATAGKYCPKGTTITGWKCIGTAETEWKEGVYGIDSYVSKDSANQYFISVPRKKYSVSFYGNGETEGSTPSHTAIYCGKTFFLNGNGFARKFSVHLNGNGGEINHKAEDISRIESTFCGWNRKADGSAKAYKEKENVSNLSLTDGEQTALYAQWKDTEIILPQAVRDGYTFLGYSKNKNAKKQDKDLEAGKKYKVSENTTLYAVWEAKIFYYANDATDRKTQDKKNRGEAYTIKEPMYQREGYDFAGWSKDPSFHLSTGKLPEYQPKDSYTKDEPLALYAIWARRFCVAYIGNEQTEGADFTECGAAGKGISQLEEYTFSENQKKTEEKIDKIFTKNSKKSYFDKELGKEAEEDITETVTAWSKEKTVQACDKKKDEAYYRRMTDELGASKNGILFYTEAEREKNITEGVASEEFSGESQKTELPYINLYAVWDRGPLIKAYDLYYSLEFAQSTTDEKGITIEELFAQTEIEDEEDIFIKKVRKMPTEEEKEKQTTYLTAEDYSKEDFTAFTSEGSVTITFRAEDSAGNVTRKQITVHLIDSAATEPNHREYTRFINEKYYELPYEKGGLEEESLWKTDSAYADTLKAAFRNKENNTAERVYLFPRKEILKMQEFTKEHGIGKSLQENALLNFYQMFCRK